MLQERALGEVGGEVQEEVGEAGFVLRVVRFPEKRAVVRGVFSRNVDGCGVGVACIWRTSHPAPPPRPARALPPRYPAAI
jgi:hypothetical protein